MFYGEDMKKVFTYPTQCMVRIHWVAQMFAIYQCCWGTDEELNCPKGKQTTKYPLSHNALISFKAQRHPLRSVFICVFAGSGERGVGECIEVLSLTWLEARGRRCAPSQSIFFSDNDT